MASRQSREELYALVQGISLDDVTELRNRAGKWSNAAATLDSVRDRMGQHTSDVEAAFGQNSEVAKAAAASFATSKTHLDQKATQLRKSAGHLTSIAAVLHPAVTDANAWSMSDQQSVESGGHGTASEPTPAEEKRAADHVTAIKTAYNEAIAHFQTIDTLPGQPPVTQSDGGSGAAGGGAGSQHPTGPTTSVMHPPTSQPPTVHPPNPPQVPTPTPPVHHNDPGTTPGTEPGATPTVPSPPSGGGLLQGGGTPVPSGPASVPTQVPTAPAASATPAVGGYGGADVLGAGAGAGALGSYGAGGPNGAALRFSPGQAIGGTPTNRPGAGFLSTEEEAALGRRTAVPAGGGAGGSRVGATGSGAGARGGRGAAGSSRSGGGRAGATAGGRGRDRKRGEQGPDDLWDDGSDWIDDEGTGPSVMQ